MDDTELENRLRGMLARGTVVRVDDTGPVQLVDVETHQGVIRTNVEVMHPHGFASNAPLDGALVLLLGVGGDQGDMVAMPVSSPQGRFGNMEPGEAVLHDDQGNRVYIRGGSIVEVAAAASMKVYVGGSLVLEVDPTGASITGSLTVSQDVVAGGVGGVSLLEHKHGGVVTGGSLTDPPERG